MEGQRLQLLVTPPPPPHAAPSRPSPLGDLCRAGSRPIKGQRTGGSRDNEGARPQQCGGGKKSRRAALLAATNLRRREKSDSLEHRRKKAPVTGPSGCGEEVAGNGVVGAAAVAAAAAAAAGVTASPKPEAEGSGRHSIKTITAKDTRDGVAAEGVQQKAGAPRSSRSTNSNVNNVAGAVNERQRVSRRTGEGNAGGMRSGGICLLYTSPSPRD